MGGCNMICVDTKSLGFRTDLMVRQMAGSEIEYRDGYVVVRTIRNPGFWWGNFILVRGELLDSDPDAWQGIFRSEFPSSEHLAIGLDTEQPPGDSIRTYLDELGLSLEVSAVMVSSRLIPPRPHSTDIELRQLSSESDWSQLLEMRSRLEDGEEHFGSGYGEFQRLYCDETREMNERFLEWTFGAFLGHRLLGSVGIAVESDGLARFQNVLTATESRRTGIASNLVFHVGRFAESELDATRLVMVADPTGPAIGIYRQLGFVDSEVQVMLQKGV